MDERTIHSDKLKGLVVDHEECPEAAPSHSTGKLEPMYPGAKGDQVMDWALEFVCEVCGQEFGLYHDNFNEQVRAVLLEHGIDAK
jgi:hypothetical protein